MDKDLEIWVFHANDNLRARSANLPLKKRIYEPTPVETDILGGAKNMDKSLTTFHQKNGDCKTIIIQQPREGGIPISTKTDSISAERFAANAAASRFKRVTLWDVRFAELKKYREKYGDCLVPSKYVENPALGKWVENHRSYYKKFREGKKGSKGLNEERICALEGLGFVWSIKGDNSKLWDKRFLELQHYKELYGHCLVPQKYAGNPTLGKWVNHQRVAYKKYCEGEKGSRGMSVERIHALEALGFVWGACAKNNNNN